MILFLFTIQIYNIFFFGLIYCYFHFFFSCSFSPIFLFIVIFFIYPIDFPLYIKLCVVFMQHDPAILLFFFYKIYNIISFIFSNTLFYLL
jgi:hypothetical protein